MGSSVPASAAVLVPAPLDPGSRMLDVTMYEAIDSRRAPTVGGSWAARL